MTTRRVALPSTSTLTSSTAPPTAPTRSTTSALRRAPILPSTASRCGNLFQQSEAAPQTSCLLARGHGQQQLSNVTLKLNSRNGSRLQFHFFFPPLLFDHRHHHPQCQLRRTVSFLANQCANYKQGRPAFALEQCCSSSVLRASRPRRRVDAPTVRACTSLTWESTLFFPCSDTSIAYDVTVGELLLGQKFRLRYDLTRRA